MKQELPNNWIKLKLSDITIFLIGGDWGIAPDQTKDDYILTKVIRGTDFKNWLSQKADFAEKRLIKTNSILKRKLEVGDIVVEVSGGSLDQPVGRSIIIDERTIVKESMPLICSNFFRRLSISKLINSFYVSYFLQFAYNEGEFNNLQSQSTNLRNLKVPDFLKTIIPIPPLAEQERIVAKINSLTENIEATRIRLESIPTILKDFRQAILTSAITGSLTKEWRKQKTQGESATTLLAKVINTRKLNYEKKIIETTKKKLPKPKPLKFNFDLIQPYPIPKTWAWTRLLNLAELNGGVAKGKNLKGKQTIELPYLRVANVQDGFLDLTEIKTIRVVPQDLEKHRLIKGDILFTEGGDRDKLGRGTIWNNEIQNCIHQNHIFRARVNMKYILPEYVSFFTKTKVALDYFFKNASQTVNLASISMSMLSNVPLAIPPFEEQKEIVKKINQLLQHADSIEKRYNVAKKHFDQISKTVLRKAFEGKLVSQNFNDVKTSDLQEKILAERNELMVKQKVIQTQLRQNMKNSTKKQPLLEFLRHEFETKSFSYDELRGKRSLGYNELKEELFDLLDKENILDMSYDTKEEKMKFKLL